ncbi:hypothetical protein BDZ89DRAFT_356204 [Hymenopellis radicata]|nr:hypothetical protein BDZ89DRAFT_356204 [Hymenopellis radicata]
MVYITDLRRLTRIVLPFDLCSPEVPLSGPFIGNANERYDVDNDPSLFDFDFDPSATQFDSSPPGLVQYQSGSPSVPATEMRSPGNADQVPNMNSRRPRSKRGRNKEASLRRKKKATHMCPECNSTFTTSARMRDHVNSEHHDLDIVCDVCPKKFRHTTSLHRHKRAKHPEPTPSS